ncbi:MAG: hypothetical protein Q9M25_03970 [Mariprofundaceae bacterium]|nr:hypothetical protein [Mariprofundaceae bacterium]
METEAPIWLMVISSLFSGLAAYGFSTYFYVRHEQKKEKLSILREIMGNRHGLTPEGNAEANARFFQALNSAFAVFHGSKPVVKALQDFKKNKGRSADNVTQLIREMSKDLKIDTSYLEDSFFDEPFTPSHR